MALSDKSTRAELRAICRRDLMDPAANWWSDTELNGYLNTWQARVQEDKELVWGSATVTATGSSTFTNTDFASDILRPARIVWNARELVPLTVNQLRELDKDWRAYGNREAPLGYLRENLDTFTVWPSVQGTSVGTLVVEYPKEVAFATDTSTHQIPAWAKWSARPYVGFRAHLRRGPNFDSIRAQRYKQDFDAALITINKFRRNYFPNNFLRLKPGGDYEKHLLDPIREFIPNYSFPEDVPVLKFADEVPSGTPNGVLTTFTLTYSPNPTTSLELELDGSTLVQGTHYTLSGSTITMIAGAPVTGQSLFARYRYQG